MPDARPGPRANDPLGLAYRILLHIARQGRYGPDEVPPRALSQAGIVEALGVTQGAIVGALQEFVAAEILSVERDHVRGTDRRVKVYRLTLEGERLVHELRRRQVVAAPPVASAEEDRPAPAGG